MQSTVDKTQRSLDDVCGKAILREDPLPIVFTHDRTVRPMEIRPCILSELEGLPGLRVFPAWVLPCSPFQGLDTEERRHPPHSGIQDDLLPGRGVQAGVLEQAPDPVRSRADICHSDSVSEGSGVPRARQGVHLTSAGRDP